MPNASLCLLVGLSLGQTAREERIARTYDIGFLTSAWPEYPALLDGARLSAALHADGAYDDDPAEPGIELRRRSSEYKLPFETDSRMRDQRFDRETIVALLRSSVAADSWAEQGISLEVAGNELRVSQTAAAHAEIAKLLAGWTAQRARLLTLEIALVPPEALAKAAPASDGPFFPAGAFDAALTLAGELGRHVIVTALDGQLVSAVDGRERSALVDLEVNETGMRPVCNPTVRRIPFGLSIECRPRNIDEMGSIEVETTLALIVESGPSEKRESAFGEIELLSLDQTILNATVIVPPSEAVLVGQWEESAKQQRGPSTVLIRGRTSPSRVTTWAPPKPLPGRSLLRTYDIRFLLPAEAGESADREAGLLLELIRSNLEPAVSQAAPTDLTLAAGGRLLVIAPAPAQERVQQWIAQETQRRGRMAKLVVEELEGPREAIADLARSAGASGALPSGWRESPSAAKARRTFRSVVFSLWGRSVHASAISSRDFIRGYQVVSGGCALPPPMRDPTIESAGQGFSLRASVRDALLDENAQVELFLGRYQVEFSPPIESGISIELRGPVVPVRKPRTPDAKGELPAPFRALPEKLDQPEQQRRPAQFLGVLPVGVDRLVLHQSLDNGESRLVVLSVRWTSALGRER